MITNKILCYTGVGEVPNRIICKNARKRCRNRNSRQIDLVKQRLINDYKTAKQNNNIRMDIVL